MSTDSNRRRFLQLSAIGVATSLAGCSASPFVDDENSRPSFEATIGDVTVKEAPGQYGSGRGQFIIISDGLRSDFEVGNYEQVRVENEADPEARWQQRPIIYTTRTDPDFVADEDEERVAWMSRAGMRRLGLGDSGSVKISPFASHPEITSRNEAEELNEFIEQSVSADRDILACAPHGGQIAKNTERQSLFFSSESDYSSWLAAGYDNENAAVDRWFVPPELINTKSFYELGELDDNNRFNFAVSFIKIRDEDAADADVIIGGLANRQLRGLYAEYITEALPEGREAIVQSEGVYDGSDTGNIVNKITDSGTRGVQVAQSQTVLASHWEKVAEACLEAHEAYFDEN